MALNDKHRFALSMIMEGVSLKRIAADLNVDVGALQRWRESNPEFKAEWAKAAEIGHEYLADTLIDIHIEQFPLQARIYSDNIKWLLARRAAAKYGDRLDITAGVTTIDVTKALTDARARVAQIDDASVLDAELVEASGSDTELDAEALKKLLE